MHLVDGRCSGAMIDLEGLPAFHALLEDPFEALVAADVATAHSEAHRANGWLVFMESLELRPRVRTDTECVAELLRHEEMSGVRWMEAA